MKGIPRISHVACLVAGVMVGLGIQFLGDTLTPQRSTTTTPNSDATGWSNSEPADPILRSSQPAPAVSPIPTSPNLTAQTRMEVSEKADPSAEGSKLMEDIAQYVLTFQPGVYRDEPMPQFAVNYLYPSDGEQAIATEQAMRYTNEPMDAWAVDMEQRLRAFFETQPEVLTTRITVSCRVSQCQAQITELPTSARLSGVFGARLSREPWYRENFLPINSGGITPKAGDAHYARMIFARRQEQ